MSPIHNLDGIYISSILVIEKMGMNKHHWIAQIWSNEQTKVLVNKRRSNDHMYYLGIDYNVSYNHTCINVKSCHAMILNQFVIVQVYKFQIKS